MRDAVAGAGQFEAWVQKIRAMLRDDNNCLIVVLGRVRSGKSTVAKRIAVRIDPKATVKQWCWSFNEFYRILRWIKPFKVVVWDEVVKGGYKRDWGGRDNKDANKMLITWGKHNLCGFVCAPSQGDVDRGIMAKADYRLHVQRGHCEVYRATRGDFQTEAYWDFMFSFPFDELPDDDELWQDILAAKDAFTDSEIPDEDSLVEKMEDRREKLRVPLRQVATRHGLRCRPPEE